MGRLRGWLRRLERESEGEMVSIPQQNGSVARFPQSAYKEAFLNVVDRMGGGGADVPPRHPLLEAARNSSDPRWRESFFSDIDYDGTANPVPDLSEGS
jgi:hypothetical protein